MKSQIRKPAILASGLLFVNNDGAYIGINNETYKILTEIVSFEAGFNVTLLDDTGATVKNQQVTCTTNSQQYTTNSSGQIPETIYYEGTSLTFTWSTSSTNWSSVSGILQQSRTTTSNYTAVVNGGVIGQVLNLTSNNATVQTSTSGGTQYRINASATVGNTITIGSKQYIIAHTDSSNVYVVLRYLEETTVFDSGDSTDYVGSDIANKCSSWYTSNVPSAWRSYATNSVSTEGVTAACFIPTYDQVNGGWSYFNSDSRRVFTDSSGSAKSWWTASYYSYTDATIWTVYPDGSFAHTLPYITTVGFRPALALKRSLFIS